MSIKDQPHRIGGGHDIGVDIGGTFTDIVCREDGRPLRVMKVRSTPRDPSLAVIEALGLMRQKWGIEPQDVRRFIHGTTVATNAVLERRGARVGLLATAGFKDVLEIGRQLRHDTYKIVLDPQTPVFLAPGRYRKGIRERMSAQAGVITPLDEQDLQRAVQELVEDGVTSIAICFLFSFLNPQHELRAKTLIQKWFPDLEISLSHEVDPQFREYERTVATAFDAYVKPRVGRYLGQLQNGLAEAGVACGLQIMQSRGGLSNALTARQRPLRLFLSGPAGGVIGGRIAGALSEMHDLVTIDVGGTSADIALISQKKPALRQEGLVDGFPVRVPMVDVNAIGSGGGSIASVDVSGGLRVGPKSAGSDPGPACYGRGGSAATVTDASVVLGYLDPEYFAGGSFTLDRALAEAAIEAMVARPLGLSLQQAALGIHRILNAQMAEGIRLVSVRQGIDPRRYALVPLGGAGGIHAAALANELGMTKIVVPRIPGVLAAAGLLAAPVEHEMAAALPIETRKLNIDALRDVLDHLDQALSRLMVTERVSPETVRISYFADVCYVGQSHTLEIALDRDGHDLGNTLHNEFLTAHARVYGHSVEAPSKLVNVRAVHQAGGASVIDEMRLERSPGPAVVGERDIFLPGHSGPVSAKIYQRSALETGFKFSGPAILQQEDTTTIVPPGWVGIVDVATNVILTKE